MPIRTPPSTLSPVPASMAGGRASDATAIPSREAGPARVAAIIVTWNRKDQVQGVLRALAAQSYPIDRLDVVVVDNGSTDGSPDHLARAWHPEHVITNPTELAHQPDFRAAGVNGHSQRGNAGGFRSLTLIRNSFNLGGCGGFNTGFAYIEAVLDAPTRAGRPAYVWLVDDDVDLPPGALERLVHTADSDPSIGIVGSRAVDFADRQTTIETTIFFDFARGRMNDTPIPEHPRRHEHQRWVEEMGGTRGLRPFTGLRDVDVVSACSLLARWSAVRQVGYWDYRYFIYCDDADWCLRFARAGHRVVCDLDAVVYHTPWFHKLTPARLYYSQRNVVWVIQKIFPPGRLKYATFRWLASILYDCLAASFHRRIFHAEIIRRTAADVVSNRGGRLDNEGPPKQNVGEALAGVEALDPEAEVVVLCTRAGTRAWARELREEIDRFIKTRPGLAQPRWTLMIRNDLPDAREPDEPGVRVVEYSGKLRSKLRRQVPMLLRPPQAVVVFDQNNDVPLYRGRWNIHIDRKWPNLAQAERDGLIPRAAFWARWAFTAARALVYSATVRPYRPPHKYG